MAATRSRAPAEAEPALPADAARLLADLGVNPDPRDRAAIGAAWRHSGFLRGLMRGNAETLVAYLLEGPERALAGALALAGDDAVDAAGLRRAKARAALVLALADISGRFTLEQVTEGLSDLADCAIDAAIRIAIAERVPGAAVRGFAAIALGKLGSRELNYSSDVDLILLYDRESLPRRHGDDPETAAVRIGRRVVELLQSRDANGYVFRVDLRLRPNSEVAPIVVSVRGAETYYQSEALAWERAAFIRARTVGGDKAMGDDFLAAIEPFIWRRSLDYTAIRDIQDMSLQIRDHFEDGQSVGPGYDLKRGRGGIREIEFFAQIHQLIFGGRDYSLRVPATLPALAALAEAGRIKPDEAEALSRAYRMLRTSEHRLQMLEDQQTHSIPTRAPERKALAGLAGYRDWPAMERDLRRNSGAVGKAYDALIAEAEADRLPRAPAALKTKLKALGIDPPDELADLIARWRGRPYRSLRSDAAQREFETALPGLAAAFGRVGIKRQALHRFDDFLKTLPTSIQFFALIEANPRIGELIARVMDMAPLLAGRLGRRPEMLDIMLAAEAFQPLPDTDTLAALLGGRLARHRDFEAKLDEVRRWIAERRFQIGVQLIDCAVDPLHAAADYARLADAAIRVLAPAVEEEFALRHGRVPGGRLVVLGFGRYGGAMLTEKSDLDLVYLFSGSHETMSDGLKPLAATTWFNRLAQRLSAALSVNTAAGPLYEVDTRLRPSGTQGLLAVSVATFAHYQLEQAWSLEHMALTRARVVLASEDDRMDVEHAVAAALGKPRAAERLRAEVLEMREDIARTHANGGLWDVKHAAGGLIDLEFAVHFLQLSRREGFGTDLGAAVSHFERAELLPAGTRAAHDLMTRLLVVLRLIDSDNPAQLSDPVKGMLAASAGSSDFETLKTELADAKRIVTEAWFQVLGTRRKGK